MIKDTTDEMSHIHKHIYISNYKNAKNINTLIAPQIGAVLYIGNRPKSKKTQKMYDTHNIHHAFIPMDDTMDADISGCFETAWKFINDNIKQKRNILIHCRRGISRSPTIVAYYLMRLLYEYKLKHRSVIKPFLNEILDLIQLYRPCTKPNINFILQLKMYENKLLKV
jgi:predicted protein tyrosine phosphatase